MRAGVVRSLPLTRTAEDAVLMVVDELEARPGRLVAARQGDLPPVEGVESLALWTRSEKLKPKVQRLHVGFHFGAAFRAPRLRPSPPARYGLQRAGGV